MSEKQKLFVMIKPDGVKRGLIGEIISRFEKKGFNLEAMKMVVPSCKLVEGHYEEHSKKGFFDDLVKFTTSGPVVAMIWNGDVQVARKLVGSTLPWKADVGTIRGDMACCMRENLVHCSDSVESSKREITLWFSE